MIESGSPIPVRVWTGYTFLLLAVVLVIVDYTIADCVVPNLVRDLDLTVDDVGAAMTSYLAVAAAFTIPGGKLADRIGRRRLLLAGLTLYAAGSVLTGLAWSYWQLLAGRVLQGLSLASVLPSGLGLLNSMFPPQQAGRHRALGLWATAIGAAAGLGPLIGGALAVFAGVSVSRAGPAASASEDAFLEHMINVSPKVLNTYRRLGGDSQGQTGTLPHDPLTVAAVSDAYAAGAQATIAVAAGLTLLALGAGLALPHGTPPRHKGRVLLPAIRAACYARVSGRRPVARNIGRKGCSSVSR